MCCRTHNIKEGTVHGVGANLKHSRVCLGSRHLWQRTPGACYVLHYSPTLLNILYISSRRKSITTFRSTSNQPASDRWLRKHRSDYQITTYPIDAARTKAGSLSISLNLSEHICMIVIGVHCCAAIAHSILSHMSRLCVTHRPDL